ncbi:MAG TPA: hypothetical protein IAA88_01155 [Candidatus Avimuribaculum pullicola]|nr:hypothetical protein [Candidatus Avimuribaculum pullicola]
MKGIIATAVLAAIAITAGAQGMGKNIPSGAGNVVVTIDSIDTDRSYLMVTVMRDNFTPFDYEMLPSQRGSMTVEMRTPPGNMPFSVMAYEDINLNRRLDLDANLVPTEKSAVVHCTGGETAVALTLVHYDKLLKKLPADTAATTTVPADSIQAK